jgi:putative transposase
MPFWQLFYHIVWATKNRAPLVTPDSEPAIYGLIQSKVTGLEGTVFALNGMPDHVHLVAAVPPKISVANFIGQVKGVASAKYNKLGLSETPLYWQEEYGVFTFDYKRLPNFVGYVQSQKQHHAEMNLIAILERMDDNPVRMIREPMSAYGLEDSEWRREMAAL